MNVLPEGWAVLEGDPNPSILVDREVLRSAWVCIKGEKVAPPKQALNSGAHSNASEYAHLKNALTELRKVKMSGIDTVIQWHEWARKHQEKMKSNGLLSSATDLADRIRETKRLLAAFIVGVEAEMGIGGSPDPYMET